MTIQTSPEESRQELLQPPRINKESRPFFQDSHDSWVVLNRWTELVSFFSLFNVQRTKTFTLNEPSFRNLL